MAKDKKKNKKDPGKKQPKLSLPKNITRLAKLPNITRSFTLTNVTTLFTKHKYKVLAGAVGFVIICLSITVYLINPAISVGFVKGNNFQADTSLTATNDKNLKISLEKNGGYIVVEDQKFQSNSNTVYLKNVTEGRHKVNLYGMKNLFFFKFISKESRTIEVDFDYTSIDAEVQDKKEVFYKDVNNISIIAKESLFKVVSSIDGTEKELKCTQQEREQPDNNPSEDESIQPINCPLELKEIKTYKFSLYLLDEAGNKTYLYKDEEIKRIIPMEVKCENLPVVTNQQSLTLKCKPNKTGSIDLYGKVTQVKKDTAFDLPIKLAKEGKNDILLKLVDDEKYEYEQTLSITRDTKAPIIQAVSIPKEVIWNPSGYEAINYINISFKADEDVTVDFTLKGYYDYYEKNRSKSNYTITYLGTVYRSVALKKGDAFTNKTHAGQIMDVSSNSGMKGNPGSAKVYITLTDKAGNKSYQTYTIWLTPYVMDFM